MKHSKRSAYMFENVNITDVTITLLLSVIISAFFIFVPDVSFASVNVAFIGYPQIAIDKHNYIDDTAIAAMDLMTGKAGKALCSVAIIAAGLGALFGRITWLQAMIVTLAVGVVFGASNVFNMLSGNTSVGHQINIIATGKCDNLDFGGYLPAPLPLNRVCDMLRNAVNAISGGTGALIATMAILFLGLGALFGKVTFPQAIVLSVGIALIFGAIQIVELLWVDPGDCLLNAVFNLLVMSNQTEFVMCRFLAEIRGDTGKFLATLVVIIMGFLALFGRLSWTVAAVNMVGMALVFGSDQIVNILVPTSWSCETVVPFNFSFTTGAIEGVLCNVLNLITGPAGKALASASIVMLGFGAMMGKVSYASALVVATGIAIAFGAPQIVFLLTGMIDICALNVSFDISTDGLDLCSMIPVR